MINLEANAFFPKEYGHDCFTAIMPDREQFRIYKMDCRFSSLAEEYYVQLYISRSNLKRWYLWNKAHGNIVDKREKACIQRGPMSLAKAEKIVDIALKSGVIKAN